MAKNPYPTQIPFQNPLYMQPGVQMGQQAANTINAIPQPVAPKAPPPPAPPKPTAPVVDPKVAAARAAARGEFNAQKSNLYSSVNEATSNTGSMLTSSILDYIDSLRAGQRGIDNMAVNNELAKVQGTQGVYGMVGRGIQSGGVVLANKNAGSSSATEALARAYGDLGRRELSNVGNQYELGNRDIQQAQLGFDEQAASGQRKLTESKTQAVNSIVSEARTQLAALNAAAARAELPDRVDIEREKEAIKAQVLSQLQQYDQQISGARGGVSGMSAEQRMAEANRLANAGTAATNPFEYTSEIPTSLQSTGPFPTQLPIFTYNGRRQDR